MTSNPLDIIHIDMDAFFASVEQRDDPKLRGRPVIVGGMGQRGVVSTASYEAREYGVHSAQPMSKARALCPDGIFLPVDREKYEEVARRMRRIMAEFSPRVEHLSLDEAFLDVSHTDGGIAEGAALKRAIKRKTDLTASVGVSYNKFLAKLGSDWDKPDGFVVFTHNRAQEILPQLPVGEIWGIGPKTEAKLNEKGIFTVGQLRKIDYEILESIFGSRADHISQLAWGRDSRRVEPQGKPKSLGTETTFGRDIEQKERLQEVLVKFAAKIDRRLADRNLRYATVTVKIRYEDFTTKTKSHTLRFPRGPEQGLELVAKELLDEFALSERAVRLIGLTVSGLRSGDRASQAAFDFLVEPKTER